MAPVQETSNRNIITPPLNRKYLRAFHEYQPQNATLSGSTGGTSVTVPLNEGDVVLVHLTHANGWADGTVLQTGARGWIPTNFCHPYDHPYIRRLMHGSTQLWDYLSSEGGGRAMVDERQDYVQALIAGVRRLLEHCDCLHRDDSQIQRHVGLRRARKGLLADLATLIRYRQQIQDTFFGSMSMDFSWSTTDDYMEKAFKVVCRGITFLDLWIQGGPKRLRIVSSFDQQVDSVSCSATTASFSPTSPAHLRDTLEDDVYPGAEEIKDLLSWVHRDGSTSHDSHHSPGTEPQSFNFESELQESVDVRDTEAKLSSRSPYQRLSLFPNSQPQCCYGLATQSEEPIDSEFASEQLSAAHDHLLGHIGTFLGLHLQPRSSLDLASATRLSLGACTGLIAIVKEIWMVDPQGCPVVYDAMQVMQKSMENLAKAAKDLCTISEPLEDPAPLRPEQGKNLVTAATACVRAAGDCTSKTRLLLDHNGDFVIDMDNVYQHQLMISLLPKDNFMSIGSSVASTVSEEDLAPPVPEEDIHPVRPGLHARSATTGDLSTRSSTSNVNQDERPGSSPGLSPTPQRRGAYSSIVASFPPSRGLIPTSHLKLSPPIPLRKTSTGASAAESASICESSSRDSATSGRSPTSTGATTPDKSQAADPAILNSFCSISSMRSEATTASESSELEAEILAKSYAHELLYNREGQVLGGTLRALVEKLTSQHSPPDPTFLNTFYLTFRQFTTSVDLAQALIDRFRYVGESRIESMPVRLRIYNFIKGWLESHWFTADDALALTWLREFATQCLKPVLPGPGQRLEDLVERVSQQAITNAATQLLKPVSKTTLLSSIQSQGKDNTPSSVISRSQLNTLRTAQVKTTAVSITDFDPLEIARQYTLTGSTIFCAIEAEELLNLNWTRNSDAAVNVRAMARYSTDLTNVVADSILSIEDTKKRAIVLKHWIEIGKACLSLGNYDCVMAIVCSLTSSPIIRLRATWDQLKAKWKTQFNEVKSVVDVSRNYAVLRQQLQAAAVPCLPFVGIFLTDLTFVDAGNQDTRILPNSGDTVRPVEVINFDKHMRTARIISQLQRFQVPYRLQPVTELQTWLEAQMSRVRGNDECSMQAFWRRSLKVEPRSEGPVGGQNDLTSRPGTSGTTQGGSFKLGHKVSMSGLNGVFSRDKKEFLSTLGFKNEGELKAKIAGAS